jgi:ketosteroid isomerase-like protein
MTPPLFVRTCLVLAGLAAGHAVAATHDGDAHAAAVPMVAAEVVDPAPAAAVDAFSAAMKAGDLARMGELLADDVLVLESGGAERSKAEYFAEHAAADAAFLKDAHVQQTRRTVRVDGDHAWIGTESELHATREGQPLTLLSSETMVLKRTPAGWRIVHIHWSSRPKA